MRVSPGTGPGPGRRVLGVLAIALAVVVAVVVTRSQRPIAGHAVAAPVPGPPAVGDCAATPAGLVVGEFALFETHRTGGTFPPAYPSNDGGSSGCAGPHYGEVVTVISVPVDVDIAKATGDGYALMDPNMDRCYAAAAGYVGADAPADPTAWGVAVGINAALIGPDDRQRQAGQRWAACVTFVVDGGATGAVATVPYRGTLRDAAHTGNQRDLLGFCGDDASEGSSPGGCARPHSYELIATTTTGDQPSSGADARSACVSELTEATGIPGLASIGGLRTDLTTSAGDTVVDDAVLPPGTGLTCGISTTGGKHLQGSLRALGADPIPWT